jgi:hypothetical protein
MWYRTGTITLTQGSKVVTGDLTNWITQQSGWILFSEQSASIYEIDAIVSSTEATLVEPFDGTTAAELSYAIIPTMSLNVDLAIKIDTMLRSFTQSRDYWAAVVDDFNMSTYTLWLDQGNVGTLDDFLAFLVGPRGIGSYDLWLELGNTGSKQDYLDEISNDIAAIVAADAEAAADSETAAGASETAAASSETAAANSETNAGASETAAGISETNAGASEDASKLSETAAGASETAAASSETAAGASETAAGTSEVNSKASEDASKLSETAAGASETASASSETATANSETAAASSETASANSETAAGTSEVNSKASEDASKLSENAADASETASASSETASAASETAAASSETNASASETAAGISETNAGVSEDAAKLSEDAAKLSETAAETSETNAANSEIVASTAATTSTDAEVGAVAARDDLFSRYIGRFADDTAATNSGYTIEAGLFYWSTGSSGLRIYDGTNWTSGVLDTNGALIASNNLSEVDPAPSRGNLGLGTAATTAATDYATAAQGITADSALQSSDIGSAIQAFDAILDATTASFLTAEKSKLTDIEDNADVTDATNVAAAGALMEDEVANLTQIKTFNAADYATAAQGITADSALQSSDVGTAAALDVATSGNATSGQVVMGDDTRLNATAQLSSLAAAIVFAG